MYPIVLFLLALGSIGGNAQVEISICDDLDQQFINYTVLQAYSPWYVLRSSDPTYNCTNGMLTGPAPFDGTTYTFIMLQNNTVKNVASVQSFGNDYSLEFTTCAAGAIYDYHFLVFNDNYIITYICDPDGKNVLFLRGYGHTAADGQQIDADLANYNLNFSNNARMVDTFTGCPPSPYCTGFYM